MSSTARFRVLVVMLTRSSGAADSSSSPSETDSSSPILPPVAPEVVLD
jgi:hypothetical protein